jgi:tetratricopeptide (TPR) repeat protein
MSIPDSTSDAQFDAWWEEAKELSTQGLIPTWTDEEIESHPLFCTDVSDISNKPAVVAMQKLLYDDTLLEILTNFKNQGNECIKERNKIKDAVIFYTRGIQHYKDVSQIFTTQHHRSSHKSETDTPNIDFSLPNNQPKNEEVFKQLSILYSNRSQCLLKLRKPADALSDSKQSISIIRSLSAQETHKEVLVKSLFRAGQAEHQLELILPAYNSLTEASNLNPQNTEISGLLAIVTAKKMKQDLAKLATSQSESSEKSQIDHFLKIHKIAVTKKPLYSVPCDMKIGITGDAVTFPVLFLYPEFGQTDIVKAMDTRVTLADQYLSLFEDGADPEWLVASKKLALYKNPAKLTFELEVAVNEEFDADEVETHLIEISPSKSLLEIIAGHILIGYPVFHVCG